MRTAHADPAAVALPSQVHPTEGELMLRPTARTTWHVEITAYCTYLRRDAGAGAGTLRLRRNQLVRLGHHLAARDVRPWVARTEDLLAWMGQQTWAPETRKSARTAIKGFYAWAEATGRLGRRTSPARGIPAVTIPRAVPRPTPEAALQAALRAAPARERLMLTLAATMGLRCFELARVHHQDLLELPDGPSLLVRGKGGHQRLVPVVDAGLAVAIRAAAGKPGGFLFPGLVEGHISAQYVSRLLSRALPGIWTGHTLRHRAGTTAHAATKDLRAVQELLGHASVRTTERYVAVSSSAIRAAAAAAAAGVA